MATKKDYVVGSGSVFADLGYARPEEAAAKAELAHKITKIIERLKLTARGGSTDFRRRLVEVHNDDSA